VAAGDGELAARFAYENLRSLAGMSSQIQAAVEQSTALFDKRAKRAELLLLKQCFMSWGSAQYDRKHKMERVVRRMGRLKLTQAWNVRTPPLARLPPAPGLYDFARRALVGGLSTTFFTAAFATLVPPHQSVVGRTGF